MNDVVFRFLELTAVRSEPGLVRVEVDERISCRDERLALAPRHQYEVLRTTHYSYHSKYMVRQGSVREWEVERKKDNLVAFSIG
jgi:hypothetical protein